PPVLPSFPTRRSSDLHSCAAIRFWTLSLCGSHAPTRLTFVPGSTCDELEGNPASSIRLPCELVFRIEALQSNFIQRYLECAFRRSEEHTSELQSPYDL